MDSEVGIQSLAMGALSSVSLLTIRATLDLCLSTMSIVEHNMKLIITFFCIRIVRVPPS